MCFNPITIRNPAKRISKKGGQRLYLQVKCNKCAQCIRNSRREWYFRSYHQTIDTLKRGGYVYFDTLTYSEDNVPHIKDYIKCDDLPDMYCFSQEHLRGFFKRLRRQLYYHCGNSHFKYFLTCEYGSKCTKRPHYHILFYVTSGIDPFTFSRFVAKAWPFGITDGLPHKSVKYVSQHIYGYTMNLISGVQSDFPTITKVCNYVSKYVTKSGKFARQLQKRIDTLSAFVDADDVQEFRRKVDMFHRQSQGFGASYLNNMTMHEHLALLDDKAYMCDSNKVVSTFPLPMYYKRKLYYTLKKRPDKSYYWEKTNDGHKHDIDNYYRKIINICDQYEKLYFNAEPWLREMIDYKMKGRTFKDLAIYLAFYKGRSRDARYLEPDLLVHLRSDYYTSTETEYNLYDWLHFIAQSGFVNSLPDKDVYIVDEKTNKILLDNRLLYDKETFLKIHCITQNTFSDFHSFDDILSIFDCCKAMEGAVHQTTFNFQEEIKEKLKNTFIYG